MDKITFLAIILVFVSCVNNKIIVQSQEDISSKTNLDEKEYFSLEVRQNGQIIEKVEDYILLENAPFEILVNFYNIQGVDVATSWGRHYFDYPSNKNIYNCNNDTFSKECRFWSGKSGAEDRYNEDRDLLVGNWKNEVYWAYDDKDYWKSFNSIDSTKNDFVTGEIIVENIYNLDKEYQAKLNSEKKQFRIEEIQDEIFCVFATGKKNEGLKYLVELQREKFILKFK